MGTSIGQDFNLNKVRYHRIIIMCDADSDGNHIKTLLLTLFYRYFQPLIEAGYIYAAQPPLYRIQAGKEVRYAFTEDDKGAIVDEIRGGEKKRKKKRGRKKEEKEEKVAGINSNG